MRIPINILISSCVAMALPVPSRTCASACSLPSPSSLAAALRSMNACAATPHASALRGLSSDGGAAARTFGALVVQQSMDLDDGVLGAALAAAAAELALWDSAWPVEVKQRVWATLRWLLGEATGHAAHECVQDETVDDDDGDDDDDIYWMVELVDEDVQAKVGGSGGGDEGGSGDEGSSGGHSGDRDDAAGDGDGGGGGRLGDLGGGRESESAAQ